jgi:DNA polymerase-3 subunit delta'
MGRRKVFIVGDAERMVSQEGADQAANAFLKLLEEPLADTTLILTSSEPGGLLPTIRSRVVAFRCAPLGESDVRAFLNDPLVKAALSDLNVPTQMDAQVELASGAPGVLFASETLGSAMSAAREMIVAAERRGAISYSTALAQGVSSARGAFSETLDALNVVLRDRTREAIKRGDLRAAAKASRAIDAVMNAQGYAGGNVNPQLVTARLLHELAAVLHD